MGLRPLGDKIIVKVIKAKEKTELGIYLPGTTQGAPQEAEVLAVGPGKFLDTGVIQPLEVNIGDKVLFAQYAGAKVTTDEGEVLVLGEGDILAVIG